MICTLRSLPVIYDLVPAFLDECLAAEAIIDQFSFCDILADKGFIGFKWQSQKLHDFFSIPKTGCGNVDSTRPLFQMLSSARFPD